MNDLSVTLTHKTESRLVGMAFLLLAIVCGVFACIDREIIGVVIAVCSVLCSGYFFIRAGTQQTLNGDGICIKSYFGERFYPWAMVEKTKIIRTSSKDLPHIQFFIRGRKTTILVYYTKRTLACLLHYYGEPDEDRVKKPPEHN